MRIIVPNSNQEIKVTRSTVFAGKESRKLMRIVVPFILTNITCKIAVEVPLRLRHMRLEGNPCRAIMSQIPKFPGTEAV